MLLTCGDEHDSIARPGGRRVGCQHGGHTAVGVQQSHHAASRYPSGGGTGAARQGPTSTPCSPAAAPPRRRRHRRRPRRRARCACCGRDRSDVELAYLPADRGSAAARIWGLAHGAGGRRAAPDEGAARRPRWSATTGAACWSAGGRSAARPGRCTARSYATGALALRGGDAAAGGDALAGRRTVARRDRPAHAARGRRPCERSGALPDGRHDPVLMSAAAGEGSARRPGRNRRAACPPP